MKYRLIQIFPLDKVLCCLNRCVLLKAAQLHRPSDYTCQRPVGLTSVGFPIFHDYLKV